MSGVRGVGVGAVLMVVMFRPLWLMTTGLISTSPVMMMVPVFSLISTRASVGSIGTGRRCTREMKPAGLSRSLAGRLTTIFFESTAMASVSPVPSASLTILAMVLAVVPLAGTEE